MRFAALLSACLTALDGAPPSRLEIKGFSYMLPTVEGEQIKFVPTRNDQYSIAPVYLSPEEMQKLNFDTDGLLAVRLFGDANLRQIKDNLRSGPLNRNDLALQVLDFETIQNGFGDDEKSILRGRIGARITDVEFMRSFLTRSGEVDLLGESVLAHRKRIGGQRGGERPLQPTAVHVDTFIKGLFKFNAKLHRTWVGGELVTIQTTFIDCAYKPLMFFQKSANRWVYTYQEAGMSYIFSSHTMPHFAPEIEMAKVNNGIEIYQYDKNIEKRIGVRLDNQGNFVEVVQDVPQRIANNDVHRFDFRVAVRTNTSPNFVQILLADRNLGKYKDVMNPVVNEMRRVAESADVMPAMTAIQPAEENLDSGIPDDDFDAAIRPAEENLDSGIPDDDIDAQSSDEMRQSVIDNMLGIDMTCIVLGE